MRVLLYLLSLTLFLPSLSYSQSAASKQMLGWVENVRLHPGNLLLHAKLAIGSDKSSMHAEDIKIIKKKDKKWVSFSVTDRNGKTETLKRPLVRIAKIKRTGEGSISRYTVKMGICLAKTYIEDEITLADRGEYDHEMLIGQSVLAGNFTIDPALTYTKKPTCKEIPKD